MALSYTRFRQLSCQSAGGTRGGYLCFSRRGGLHRRGPVQATEAEVEGSCTTGTAASEAAICRACLLLPGPPYRRGGLKGEKNCQTPNPLPTFSLSLSLSLSSSLFLCFVFSQKQARADAFGNGLPPTTAERTGTIGPTTFRRRFFGRPTR